MRNVPCAGHPMTIHGHIKGANLLVDFEFEAKIRSLYLRELKAHSDRDRGCSFAASCCVRPRECRQTLTANCIST
ncbi:hypothetical protein EUGRSUZ_C02236 [Eucalyptus grandis]|uniref:Uncharacterized protein n=2 Tax=Eucalyptus grandis TaxID=71139 RepID=A0ACC3LG91_EUCGR|nr:hypothetical protein EUGRSUZ_C02236 [Eucalyptus grandis]